MKFRQIFALTPMACAAILLASCATAEPVDGTGRTKAQAALTSYYKSIPASELPRAVKGKALPSDNARLSHIIVGSCNDEEITSPILSHLADIPADMFLMIGDNVYGDRDGRASVRNGRELTELRESFAELGANSEFQRLRKNTPMMVAWDDHDYGANDAGGDFKFKELAERIHENFWGLENTEAGEHAGTYYAKSFGPAEERVQIIMLDTRFFRTPLKKTYAYGARGTVRYLPQHRVGADMLGESQWTWLETELKKPAKIRLIVSSVQVMPTVHGWEAWDKLPAARQRLFDVIEKTDAKGAVFVSGDRHIGVLYEGMSELPYSAYELTTSSLNLPFARGQALEVDAQQIGQAYGSENYGDIAIDWTRKIVSLSLKNKSGQTVRQTRIPFADIGL